MEKILLITMGWLFVVGGAVVLGVLLEHMLHRHKSERQDENFFTMKYGSPEKFKDFEEEERTYRRSA